MIIKKKNVYYCEFCKKKSLRSLKEHEHHCTANPNRECRLCERESIKEIIEKYKKYFYVREVKIYYGSLEQAVFKKKFTLKNIINELDYICPNCILSIIRCLGLNRYYMKDKFKFDYKKALDNWWKIANKEAWEKERREIYY